MEDKRKEIEGASGRISRGWGVFDAWTMCSLEQSEGLCFRADVLTVSGSMEGEIPTKEGVQILWEIRPLFNIS